MERAAKWPTRASRVFLQGDCLVGSTRSISAAVALSPVLTQEVMEMSRSTWVSGMWCWVGKQGLARHPPPRALLTAGVSFSNERAVVAKASCE